MAVAVKSPLRERLIQLIEQRRALAKRVVDLEDALPVVEEVVVLMKEKKAVGKELEGLKRRKKELEAKRAELLLKQQEALREQKRVERELALIEEVLKGARARERVEAKGSEEGGKEAEPQKAAGPGSAKGTPQPSLI